MGVGSAIESCDGSRKVRCIDKSVGNLPLSSDYCSTSDKQVFSMTAWFSLQALSLY
ncbi:hypothetical protein KC19_10G151400 [Ceratodon purpureus]|uniref:Uncharacterized protein n=1 Tax=Ceratodon purpureus TaxID=3225 RepID=A0A8T0GM22_CERPU|nr:hypothetical protein KC19_10G151400 [Ceratodon purpureus]